MVIRTGNRRDFLRVSATSALLLPMTAPVGRTMADESKAKNDRPRLGLIGCGGQGSGDASAASHFGDFVAVCDVDKKRAEAARTNGSIGKGQAEVYGDYRKLLDRKDIDAVIVGTPDHWHTKVSIDAMKAGKDLYCEKPLTLTILEGKQLGQVVKSTGRVLQVGTQQRSDHNKVFQLAVAMVRAGRIGKIKKVIAGINGAPSGGPFKKENPPPESQLGDVARPGAQGRVHQAALPLRVPLVVRVLRRQAHRLGCAPRRYRPVGPGDGQLGPAHHRGRQGPPARPV